MALPQLLDFLKAATGYVKPEAADLEEAGSIESPAVRYHTRVIITAAVCGVIVSITGTICAVMENGSKNDLKMLLIAPLLFGAVGILFGVAVACLVAPHEFLTGPVGRKWMALIGTKSVLGARITCAVLALAIPGVPAILALIASLGRK